MFKKIISYTLAAFVAVVVLAPSAQAQTYVGTQVRIEGPDGTIFNDMVYTSGCTITDSDSEEHTYDSANALCALDAASHIGGFDYEVQNSVYGIYLTSINGVTAPDDFSEYWSFYANFQLATVGIADFMLADGDTVLFTYGSYGATDPLRLTLNKKQVLRSDEFTVLVEVYDSMSDTFMPVPNTTVHAGTKTVTTNAQGKAKVSLDTLGKNAIYAETDANTQSNTEYVSVFKQHNLAKPISMGQRYELAAKGVSYLLNQVDSKGRISDNIAITEWSVIAIEGAGSGIATVPTEMRDRVLKYNPKVSDGTSELARHILALEAMGIDSRNVDGKNYVKRLKATRVNDQYGSELYANDDVSAGLALLAAGEPVTNRSIKQAVRGAKSGMNDDGGISYSVAAEESDVDSTAYFVEFLAAVNKESDLSGFRSVQAYNNAVAYLRDQQNLDGGWTYQRSTSTTGVESNSSTTAGVLRALQAVDGRPDKQMKNNRNGFNFLQNVQRKSGAFAYDAQKSQSLETFNTAYAVMGLTQRSLPINR